MGVKLESGVHHLVTKHKWKSTAVLYAISRSKESIFRDFVFGSSAFGRVPSAYRQWAISRRLTAGAGTEDIRRGRRTTGDGSRVITRLLALLNSIN